MEQQTQSDMPKLEYWMLNIINQCIDNYTQVRMNKSGINKDLRAIQKVHGVTAATDYLRELTSNPFSELGKLHATRQRIEEIKEYITVHAQQPLNQSPHVNQTLSQTTEEQVGSPLQSQSLEGLPE